MGGSSSKSKSVTFKSDVERRINNAFAQSCTTTGTCSQSIHIGDADIWLDGENCEVDLINDCILELKGECNMTNAVKSLLPELRAQDDKFIDSVGKQLMVNGKPAFDHANIKHVDDEFIVNTFTQTCETNSSSFQSNTIKDHLEVHCTRNGGKFVMGNKARHASRCVANMVNKAIDDLNESDGSTSSDSSTDKGTSPSHTSDADVEELEQKLIIFTGVIVITMILMIIVMITFNRTRK